MKTYRVKKMPVDGHYIDRIQGPVNYFKGLRAVREYCKGSVNYCRNSRTWFCYKDGFEYLIEEEK